MSSQPSAKNYNPFKQNGLLSIGPVYFCFNGCLVQFFIFIQILIEHCKQTVETLIRAASDLVLHLHKNNFNANIIKIG